MITFTSTKGILTIWTFTKRGDMYYITVQGAEQGTYLWTEKRAYLLMHGLESMNYSVTQSLPAIAERPQRKRRGFSLPW